MPICNEGGGSWPFGAQSFMGSSGRASNGRRTGRRPIRSGTVGLRVGPGPRQVVASVVRFSRGRRNGVWGIGAGDAPIVPFFAQEFPNGLEEVLRAAGVRMALSSWHEAFLPTAEPVQRTLAQRRRPTASASPSARCASDHFPAQIQSTKTSLRPRARITRSTVERVGFAPERSHFCTA